MSDTATGRDPVRTEQLRLVLKGVGQSVPTGFLVSTLMVFALRGIASHVVLIVWYVAFLTERITVALFARRVLRTGHDRHAERILFVSKICEGLILGSLLWIGLPPEVPPISVLLMSLMGAILGNGVSLLAPLRHHYLALAIPLVAIAVVTLWSLGGTPYRTLAIFSALYVVGQYGQVRLANRQIRESIELRFENSGLVDQLRAETALAQDARRDAEHANAAKSHFLAAASHDLRQPVHAIGLFLHALGQTVLGEDQRKIVRNAQAASIASADMLNTLLDFSRIEAGVVAPYLSSFALQPLLEKLENELAPLANAKHLIYRSRSTDIAVTSDSALLEIALRNLILNAIRYTDRGGLLIACRRRRGFASIEIHDTGIGIPNEQHEEIFREFHQLGNPERDRHKGLGLGLAIVRGLTASLDHPLSLSSVAGRGSVFRILVPITSDIERVALLAPAIGGRTSLEGLSILIVDDDSTVREAMVQLLSGWGCRCWAIEGPDQLDGNPLPTIPDALICDYRLRNNVTGAEAIEATRRKWGKCVPALLITGDTAPERMREALESGIPLVHKPVPPDALYQHLLTLTGVRPA